MSFIPNEISRVTSHAHPCISGTNEILYICKLVTNTRGCIFSVTTTSACNEFTFSLKCLLKCLFYSSH